MPWPGLNRICQFVCLLTLGVMGVLPTTHAKELAVRIPAPTIAMTHQAGPLQTATFAGGCFWGIQGVFEHVRGVRRVVAGYAGGSSASATYEQVSEGNTGHAETVQISFDPAEVSYGELLHIFFSVAHDPTQWNRQGPDTGTQYRSAIFTSHEPQQQAIQAYITLLEQARIFSGNIVTQVQPLKSFYPAEAYHQDFLVRNPGHPYIVQHDLPKLAQLKQTFGQQYRARPVLTTPTSIP